MRRVAALLLLAAALAVTTTATGDSGGPGSSPSPDDSGRGAEALNATTPSRSRPIRRQPIVAPPDRRRLILPSGRRVRKAFRWARHRAGLVSIALIDTGGRMRRMEGRRVFVSASVVKAVMLAAYLRRHRSGISRHARAVLRAMITWSDNSAAEWIYYALGDEMIEHTARKAGAGSIDVRGWWSETYLSASAGARFMSKMRRVIPGRHRRFAMRLLAHITPSQQFGIPDGIGRGWDLYFKGGWRSTPRGALLHQIAVLHSGKRKLSLAVMTDGNPSMTYGIETIEGIARRLVPDVPGRGRRSPVKPLYAFSD